MSDPEQPGPKEEEVKISDLTPGPILREGLSDEQSARLRRIHHCGSFHGRSAPNFARPGVAGEIPSGSTRPLAFARGL